MDSKREATWEEIDYLPANSKNSETRIGGIPFYAVSSIGDIEWPHVKTVVGLLPLKFLAQLVLPNGQLAFLFLGVPTLDIGEDIYEPFGEFTAAIVQNDIWPEWVTPKKIDSISSNLLWSPRAVTPVYPVPTEPSWVYSDRTPKGFTNFLFQIGEEQGGLRGINIDMETYVFWDGKNKVVLFNDTY